jgi:DNA transformation protein
MPRANEFIAYVLELLAPLGSPSSRAMFGGHGIYVDAQIIAIVVDETLYLKADAQNRSEFDERGLEPFSYESNGKTYAMSYFRAPEEAFDSPQAMRPWARSALAAALRKSAGKPARRKTTGPAAARPSKPRRLAARKSAK